MDFSNCQNEGGFGMKNGHQPKSHPQDYDKSYTWETGETQNVVFVEDVLRVTGVDGRILVDDSGEENDGEGCSDGVDPPEQEEDAMEPYPPFAVWIKHQEDGDIGSWSPNSDDHIFMQAAGGSEGAFAN